MAAAWLDERDPATLFIARGRARPLWIGRTRTDVFFASTRRALAIVEAAVRIRLELKEVREGRLLHVARGRIVREQRFRPDRRYREEGYLPPVRAPHEAVSCLERLDPHLACDLAYASFPSGNTSMPSSRNRSRTRYWNAVHAPRGTSSRR